MARFTRLLLLLVLLASLPANAVAMPPAHPAPAPQPAPPAEAPAPLALKLEIVRQAAPVKVMLVRLRLEASAALRGLAVRWEGPEGVKRFLVPEPEEITLAAGEALDLYYAVPVKADSCNTLQVNVQGQTAAGELVKAEALLQLAGAPGAYTLEPVRAPAAQAAASAATPPMTVVGPTAPPDAYEPDDTAEQARRLVPGQLYTHNFHRPGDSDWVYFDATAGTYYAIATNGRGCGGAPDNYHVALYGPGGSMVWSGCTLQMIWTCEVTGRYTMELRSCTEGLFGSQSVYNLLVKAYRPVRDRYEIDDTYDQAKPATIGWTYLHTFHSPGDVDWVSFRAVEGRSYILEIPSTTWEYPLVEICNAAGVPLAPDLSARRSMAWTAPDSGRYLVRLSQATGFRPWWTYSFRIRTFVPHPDAYEPDDNPDDATLLPLGPAYQRHMFHSAGDVDWFRIDVPPSPVSATYAVETWGWGIRMDPEAMPMTLYDAEGTPVPPESPIGAMFSVLLWTVAPTTTASTFYAQVANGSGVHFGAGTEYEIRVLGPDGYEPDDTPDDAPLVPVPSTQAWPGAGRDFIQGGDDWIRIVTQPGKSYSLVAKSTLASGLSEDPMYAMFMLYFSPISLLYREGSPEPIGVGFVEPLLWQAPGAVIDGTTVQAGGPVTYYVRLISFLSLMLPDEGVGFSLPYSEYNLELKSFTPVPDGAERDDDPLAAKLLPMGSWAARNFHRPGDVDWGRFSTRAGASYAVDVQPPLSRFFSMLVGEHVRMGVDYRVHAGGNELAWAPGGAPFAFTAYDPAVFGTGAGVGTTAYVETFEGETLGPIIIIGPGAPSALYVPEVGLSGPASAYKVRVRPYAPTRVGPEPNDTPAQATPVVSNTAYIGNFHVSLDEDWYALPVQAGHSYGLRVVPLGCGANYAMGVYTGAVLSDPGVLPIPPNPVDPLSLEVMAEEDGTFYVHVLHGPGLGGIVTASPHGAGASGLGPYERDLSFGPNTRYALEIEQGLAPG